VAAPAAPAPPPQKPAAAPPQKAAATPSAPKPAAAPAAKPAEAAAGADPAGSGYVVKIVAYRDKAQSEALAARRAGKGYAAYVVTVAGKGAPLYSVRVGKFKARADADAAKRRLEKEEQFKPLITR
jgi:cell division septation protein DedD